LNPTFFKIIDFSLNPKKIEMIFLLTAEYSLKTNTEEIKMATNATNMKDGFSKTLLDQIALDTLGRDCGFGGDERSSITCIIDRFCEMKQEIERLKEISTERLQENCDTIKSLAVKHRDEMLKMLEENEELTRKVEHLKLAGYYRTIAFANHGDLNTDDAAFDHYWANDADDDLTLWKVPRHLADVKSAKTSYHGAVEQAFYDECFGEQHGKLKWFRVREMTQADLIKGGWQPKTEEDKYTDCDECGRFCYTGGEKYPDGYVCNDCDEDAENSDDDE
jgi:hypothetical protein